jgi:membrane fusion protein (multidrug efflux system)
MGLAIGLLALLVTFAGCSGETAAPLPAAGEGDAVRVLVEPVVYAPEQVRLEAVGTSRAAKSVTLHPAAAGEVTAVRFTAGQRVAAGDVLLELDARDQRLAVQLARLRLREAERQLRRYSLSQQSGALTESDLDAARTAVEAARIEARRAEVALADRTLEAPFAGIVGFTEIDPGARVTPETAVASLDDRSVLLVRFEVPEALSGRLAVGEPVQLAPWTGPDDRQQGRVVDIGSRIDADSRTFTVRAELPNAADRLRPGMSFRVALALDGPPRPVVPEVAVQWGGDGAFVWRIDDGRAVRVPVTIVQRREGQVLVDADLPPGAPVVREGVQRLREGSAVSHTTVAAAAAERP